MIIGHGGNKLQLATDLGCHVDDIIDMSSNLNPLGPPESIEAFIRQNLYRIRSLPEPDARAMKEGFAGFHGIQPDNVVAGNGTTWFIYTLPRALGAKRAVILGPTYSDYRDACQMHGVPYDHFFLTPDNGFSLDADAFSMHLHRADMVLICNPNNPTGNLIQKETLVRLLQQHPDTVFVVDESYLPFADGADQVSLVSETGFGNLIVLSSMSKIFRIPGLRTGFLSGPAAFCRKVMAYYQPWSVNALAQAVITDIFKHPEQILSFYKETRDYIRVEKQHFLDSLAGINGLSCFDSSAYFILARLTRPRSSGDFCKEIGQHRILIRDCANFQGLSDEFVRFSLKQRPDNQRLARLVKETLCHV